MDATLRPRTTERGGRAPSEAWEPNAGRILGDDLIERWTETVIRRRLNSEERHSLTLNVFTGAPGIAAFESRGLSVYPQRGQPFEAVTWEAELRDLRVEALLCSASEMRFAPAPPADSAVVVVQILSGVLLHSTPTNTLVLRPGDVRLLQPVNTLQLQTRGTFAAICVTIPAVEEANSARPGLSHEATRLRAVVELGRACLVGQLERRPRVEKDAWMLRELLVAERGPRTAAEVSRAAAQVREQVLSLIASEHTDPSFSVQQIVSCFEISRRQLYRDVPSAHGSIAALILSTRLETSIAFLNQQPTLSIEEVAARSGFRSSDQFRRAFRRVHGMTPLRYRQAGLGGVPETKPTA